MRDDAGALNAAIHKGDEPAAAKAMKKLDQSCEDCHAVFKPDVKARRKRVSTRRAVRQSGTIAGNLTTADDLGFQDAGQRISLRMIRGVKKLPCSEDLRQIACKWTSSAGVCDPIGRPVTTHSARLLAAVNGMLAK